MTSLHSQKNIPDFPTLFISILSASSSLPALAVACTLASSTSAITPTLVSPVSAPSARLSTVTPLPRVPTPSCCRCRSPSGVSSFFFFSACSLVNTRGQRNMGLWWLIFGLGLACCAVSIYYGYVSAQKIHSYCIFCLLCYLCYFAITFLAFIVIRRFHIPLGGLVKTGGSCLRSRSNLLLLATLLGSLMLLQWKLPHYWEFSQGSNPQYGFHRPDRNRRPLDRGQPPQAHHRRIFGLYVLPVRKDAHLPPQPRK